MKKTLRWRVLVVLVVVGGAAALALTRPVQLGLDLQGGTQVVLEAQDTDRVSVDSGITAQVLEVIRRRVDGLGVSEPTLQRSGDRRVIVELPGLDDPDQAVEVIGRTAQLAFHQVVGLAPTDPGATTTPTTGPAEGGGDEAGTTVLPDERGIPLELSPPRVTGEAVGSARARLDQFGVWEVTVDFRGTGSADWARLTSDAACASDPTQRRIAIVLDDEVITSPTTAEGVECGTGITGGATRITGTFTESEAKQLALLIRAGALPVPVQVVEQRTIGPTLGDEAIRTSVEAAIIGAGLTIAFLIAYYRLLGLLAAVALLVYGLISYAALLAFNATLTLPGIAGFVLAIGMAVDANVLVFERSKDEFALGRSPRSAASSGFKGAWSAIVDSNVTTLIAAGLLFYFASGAVRGFGITLSVGVVASMFTALVVTRVLVEGVLRLRSVADRPRMLGLHIGGRVKTWLERFDIMRRVRTWVTLTVVVVAAAVGVMVLKGFTFGLDFSGGRLIEYDTATPVNPDVLRTQLADLGLARAIVQESGTDNIAIRTQELSAEKEAQVEEVVSRLGGSADPVRDEFVGPTIGNELRRKAITALVIALVAQLAYLAIRFRWTFSTAAVLAMFHDLAVLIGVFALLGKTLDGVFLAALLTVIGYSINDSVVVFDRIREQRRLRAREPLATVANEACLSTVPRTINTGLGALFILFALYFLGGDTLTDFALALIVGILVGTYSSVFVATPLAVVFEGGKAQPLAVRGDRRREPARAGSSTSASGGSEAGPGPEEAPTPTGTTAVATKARQGAGEAPGSTRRPPPRRHPPRSKKRKGSKRR